MRLNRFLASCGLGSRRSCEQLVEQGRVFLNGEPVTSLGVTVKPGDQVIVDGKKVRSAEPVTLILNKPPGFVCTREDDLEEGSRETIYELLPEHLRHLHYVGRLDKDSEGLLILTNDGALTEKLTHPRFGIEKEYLVALDHVFDEATHAPKFLAGFAIEGGFARAVQVQQLEPRVVALTLAQGLKRQIRLMFEAAGYQVQRLQRVRIGALTMPELKSGRWRVLTKAEIASLLAPPPKHRQVEKKPAKPERPQRPPRPGARPDRPHDRPPSRRQDPARKTAGKSSAPPRSADQRPTPRPTSPRPTSPRPTSPRPASAPRRGGHRGSGGPGRGR